MSVFFLKGVLRNTAHEIMFQCTSYTHGGFFCVGLGVFFVLFYVSTLKTLPTLCLSICELLEKDQSLIKSPVIPSIPTGCL